MFVINGNELVEILQKADTNKLEKFMAKNKSSLKMTENIEKNQFDYSWLQKIEDTIEALDHIVRNPRKFLLQEEEIVPIEKAKKISQETIKHLAVHTNLIQDVDKEGMITPIAVLNIHKEESFDIYENRFVKSLLDNLRIFMYMRKNQTAGGSSSKIEKTLSYDGVTKIDNEDIKLTVSLETKSHEDLVERSPLGLSVGERIERLELILADFYKSPFMRDLQNALPVKSPIRKTNVILKDNNFKKLLALWEFIERYEVTDVKEASGIQEVTDKNNIAGKMDMAFFLDYAILNSIAQDQPAVKESINKFYLKKIINDFVNANQKIDEKSFKKIMINEFKNAYKEKMNIEKEIIRLITKSIKEYKDNRKQIIALLK